MPKTKEQWIQMGRRFLCAFSLYALLPLICGGFAALLIFLRTVGQEKADAVFYDLGEKSIVTLLGGKARREERSSSYYFLSSELPIPWGSGLKMMIGINRYFGTVPPSVSEEAPEKTEPPKILYESLPAGAIPVVSADLSSSSLYLNSTRYTVDAAAVRSSPFPSAVSASGNGPLVLVVHTHGTECYLEDNTNLSDFAPEGVDSYFIESETSFRTTDRSRNVVQVGKVFSETLESLGIPTLHCTVLHDEDNYNDAYTLCAETVKRYLKEYPSIQYVVDLHRDSIVRGDARVKTSAQIQGEESAQVMLVVGTNQNGRHPEWEKNLVVATAYKDTMDALYPSLSRSVYLRTARFNQEFLPGCMLLEVGSAVNSLEEACTAARFAASAFASLLESKQ